MNVNRSLYLWALGAIAPGFAVKMQPLGDGFIKLVKMTIAPPIFVAQATNTSLGLWQQLGLLAVLLLTSKGAAGVSGSREGRGEHDEAAVGDIPVVGLAVIVGIDRFMSEARALTNVCGNGVATLVVARWCGALDRDKLAAELAAGPAKAAAMEP